MLDKGGQKDIVGDKAFLDFEPGRGRLRVHEFQIPGLEIHMPDAEREVVDEHVVSDLPVVEAIRKVGRVEDTLAEPRVAHASREHAQRQYPGGGSGGQIPRDP
jgi:hypothetical protein